MSAKPEELLEKISHEARALIYWEQPLRSGIVCSFGLSGFILFAYLGLPMITLIAYGLMAHLIGRFVYRNGVYLASRFDMMEFTPVPPAKVQFLTEEDVATYVAFITAKLNIVLHASYTIAMCDDNVLMAKMTGALWLFATLARVCGASGLLFLAFVGAFTLPVGYKHKKEEVDKGVAAIEATVADLTARCLEASSKYFEMAKAKLPKPNPDLKKKDKSL